MTKGSSLEDVVVLIRDLEGMVIPDVMDDLILPQGRYPESFVLIFLLKVCQEWGVKKEELSMSSMYPHAWLPIPDTLLIKISIQNFQGIFLGVK